MIQTLLPKALRVVALGCSLFATGAWLQAADSAAPAAVSQPQPGPELKKLQIAVGAWTYQGKIESTPFSPGSGNYEGKYKTAMILGGFFLETQGEDRNSNGYVYQGHAISGYDTGKHVFFMHWYENDGFTGAGTLVINGNTWTVTSERKDSQGKVYQTRSTSTYSADGRTVVAKGEYSSDGGKTWAAWWSDTSTKVGN